MRKAFTLAEVLITLIIIGIVAAMALHTLITNIQNKVNVERMKKAYSLIQNVTNQIISEEGEPSNWILDACSLRTHEPNQVVTDLYAKKFKVIQKCERTFWRETACTFSASGYKTLNGVTAANSSIALYYYTYPLVLADGLTIGLKFKSNPEGGYFWGTPDLTFIVDVNSKKKPNQNGRDIFYFYINRNENGKVHPYGDIQEDDCTKNGEGRTCAYKILSEGKMTY